MGGGFGGKETQTCFVSLPAAVAANKYVEETLLQFLVDKNYLKLWAKQKLDVFHNMICIKGCHTVKCEMYIVLVFNYCCLL